MNPHVSDSSELHWTAVLLLHQPSVKAVGTPWEGKTSMGDIIVIFFYQNQTLHHTDKHFLMPSMLSLEQEPWQSKIWSIPTERSSSSYQVTWCKPDNWAGPDHILQHRAESENLHRSRILQTDQMLVISICRELWARKLAWLVTTFHQTNLAGKLMPAHFLLKSSPRSHWWSIQSL